MLSLEGISTLKGVSNFAHGNISQSFGFGGFEGAHCLHGSDKGIHSCMIRQWMALGIGCGDAFDLC